MIVGTKCNSCGYSGMGYSGKCPKCGSTNVKSV